MNKIGKAYGFFDCRASRQEIEGELPFIRELVNTPSQLELSLIEGVENLKGDSALLALAQKAGEAGLRYVLEATYPDATNQKTAEEVGALLNQAYQTPLYEEGEPFFGDVIYQEGKKYLFMK